MIELVTSLDEKLERLQKAGKEFLFKSHFPISRFVAHLRGLENFAGKKVLEIGAEDDANTFHLFESIGAEYFAVRIGDNPNNLSYVLPQEDFMKLPEDSPYDLIISLGVFEEFAIDRDKECKNRLARERPGHLQKLFQLTKTGGYNVHGVIANPFLFDENQIQQVGFDLLHKTSPFYCLYRNGYSKHDKVSELVVMRKLE